MADEKKTVKEPGYLVFVGPDGKVQYDGALEHIKCRGNVIAVLEFKGSVDDLILA